VHDNRRNLGLDTIAVVNLRALFNPHRPAEGSLEEPLAILADLQRQGLVWHIGFNHVMPTHMTEVQRIFKTMCVQNHYKLSHRDDDDLIDDHFRERIAGLPFFPLGGFTPLHSSAISEVAIGLETTPIQVSLASLLRLA
jgi:pyridoxine 4-dehydrogenase